MINNDGVFTYDTLFAWKSLGFSSNTNDRISFFAVSTYNGNILLPEDTNEDNEAPVPSLDDETTENKESNIVEDNSTTIDENVNITETNTNQIQDNITTTEEIIQ